MKQNFAGINGNSHFSVKFSSFTIYLSLKGMRRLDEIRYPVAPEEPWRLLLEGEMITLVK